MLPELSIIVLSYKRPWYTLITLDALMNHIHYDGTKKIIVSDGGSPEWQLQMYRESMRYYPHEILSVRSGSVSDNEDMARSRHVYSSASTDCSCRACTYRRIYQTVESTMGSDLNDR